jgi:hypothetical protein
MYVEPRQTSATGRKANPSHSLYSFFGSQSSFSEKQTQTNITSSYFPLGHGIKKKNRNKSFPQSELMKKEKSRNQLEVYAKIFYLSTGYMPVS